jgi:hypothetical protein
VQPTGSSVREARTRGVDRNRSHTHTLVPHRTVSNTRGPRLSRQVKANLRYCPGCLFPHMWFSDLKTLPLQAPPYLRSRNPRPDSIECLGTTTPSSARPLRRPSHEYGPHVTTVQRCCHKPRGATPPSAASHKHLLSQRLSTYHAHVDLPVVSQHKSAESAESAESVESVSE